MKAHPNSIYLEEGDLESRRQGALPIECSVFVDEIQARTRLESFVEFVPASVYLAAVKEFHEEVARLQAQYGYKKEKAWRLCSKEFALRNPEQSEVTYRRGPPDEHDVWLKVTELSYKEPPEYYHFRTVVPVMAGEDSGEEDTLP